MTAMGMWNNHGMTPDEEDQQDAVMSLAMFPEELTALADHADREAWVWTEVAKGKHGQERRKANLIAKFWRHRLRRWKELAAWAEQECDEEIGPAKIADPR